MMGPLRHLRQVLRAWLKPEKQQPVFRRPRGVRLGFEQLEDRLVPVATTTALSGTLVGGGALPASIIYGTPVIFTATVTPNDGTDNPTGSVDFVDGSRQQP